MRQIILIVLLSFYALQLNAQEEWTRRQTADGEWYNYSSPVFIRDKESVLSWKDALNSKELIHNANKSFGYTSDVIWLKMHAQNMGSHVLWLQVEYPAIDTIDLFVVNSAGRLVKTAHAGDCSPIRNREYRDNQIFFEILPAGDTSATILLRCHSSKSLQVPVRVGYFQELAELNHREDFFHGIYFGFMIIAVMFNLFVFFTIKERTYFYYVAYVLALGFSLGAVNGYTFEYLWPNTMWLNHYVASIATTIAAYYGLVFSIEFLDIKKRNPKQYKYFTPVLVSILAVSLFLEVIGYVLYGFFITQGCLLGIFFYVYYAVAVALKEGFRPAWIYLAAFTGFLSMATIYFYKDFGLIDYSEFAQHAVQAGSAFEVFLFSIALGTRINYYKEEKNRAVEEAFRVQQRSLQELDQFIYRSSHDLRGPLANIMGLVELMKMDTGISKDENINLMKSVATKMDTILHKLMTLTVINQERHKYVAVSLNKLVHETASKFLARDNQSESIGFYNSIPSDYYIETDEVLIQIIINNVLENAFVFKSDRRDGHKVSVNSYRHNGCHVVEITDNGTGIADHCRDRVFDMFYKGGDRLNGGTGLGLYFSKKAVEKLNGQISFETSLQGTKFVVTIPIEVE